jgi:outer membrane autotransporter protein
VPGDRVREGPSQPPAHATAVRTRGARRRLPGLLSLLAVALGAAPVAAQVVTPPRFTVTSEQDTLDVGSLRWVTINANTESGQSIDFAIPNSAGDGVVLRPIIAVTRDMLSNTSDVTINGTNLELVTISVSGLDPARIIVLDIDGSGTDVIVKDVRYERGRIVIGAGTSLTYEVTGEREITTTSAIEGDGDFTKGGAGTLRFAAANTYTGLTGITGGTLVVDTNSLPGDVLVGNGARLRFDQGFDDTYASEVLGAGALEKTGAGTLTLTQDQAYSGGTTLSGGTLVIGPSSGLSASGDILISTGTLLYQAAGDATFTGSLEGTGTFDKDNGAFDLTFGDGAFTGTLLVGDGRVTDVANALQGNVSLEAPTSILEFAGAGTNAGAISGLGAVEKSGPGTVQLEGNNSYASGTTVSGGTLVVTTSSLPETPVAGDVDALLQSDTTLVFDQDFDGTFGGVAGPASLSTPGTSIIKQGTGTVTTTELIGASTISIEDGRLNVDGGDPSVMNSWGAASESVGVGAAGTLGGSGVVFSSTDPVTVDGTLAPGSPTGVLTIDGPGGDALVFQPGARLEAYLSPTDGGAAVVNGDVALGGVGVVIDPQPGAYIDDPMMPATVDVLTASAINGSCVDATPNFAFLDHSIEQDGVLAPNCGNDGSTTLTASVWGNGLDFSDFATTPNQRSVADALDTLTYAPGSDLAAIYDNFTILTVDEVNPTLDAISGEYLSQFTTTRLAIGEHFQRTLQRRVHDGLREIGSFWTVGSADLDLPGLAGPARPAPAIGAMRNLGSLLPLASSAVTVTPIEQKRKPLGLWLDGYGLIGNVDGDGNASTTNFTLWGASLGFDGEPLPGWTIGGAFGYARTDFDVSALDSEGNGNTYQTALYGGYTEPRFRAGASFRYAYTDNGGSRGLVFSDVDRVARADFGSNDYGLRVEGGASVLRWRQVTLEPALAFDWMRLSQPSFVETGGDSLDLEVEGQDLDSLVLQLGANIRARIDMDEDTAMMPEFRAFWLHEFGDVERVVRGRISGALTGGGFTVSGAELPRDAALLGIGWAASVGANAEMVLSYDAIVGSGVLQNDIALTLRYRF